MSSSSISSGTGGVLAGTGGVVGYGASGSLTASVSTLGGAVGGVAMSTTSTGTVTVNSGANAFAIFEWN
jgi:hypothetical protein